MRCGDWATPPIASGTGGSSWRRASWTGDRWDLVFNIAEGLRGIGREAQVPAILDVYGIPYTFSDPLVMALTLHKGMTKRVLRDGGLPTPAFTEVAAAGDLDGLHLPFPLFAKPLAEGTGKGIDGNSIIRSAEELRERCVFLLARYLQPVLVERYLPGREFTVGIAGTGPRAEVLGTLEVVLLDAAEPGAYGYENKERCEELVEYRPTDADDPQVMASEALALAAWQLLGCRDAGRIDLRADEQGVPQLMELNPLAGLHPEHSDLPMIATAVGMAYDDLIGAHRRPRPSGSAWRPEGGRWMKICILHNAVSPDKRRLTPGRRPGPGGRRGRGAAVGAGHDGRRRCGRPGSAGPGRRDWPIGPTWSSTWSRAWPRAGG